MKKLICLTLALLLCGAMALPVAYASNPTMPSTAEHPPLDDTPKLPEVYDGGVVGSSSRPHYTEETRPEDSSPLNSVTDNPEYGDEFNFLTITNTATGESWRAGTMELIPGDQYLVEVYCRNDCANSYRAANYSNIQLKVTMPYQLGKGDVQPFGARLTTDTINIYASVSVVAREAVSLLYVANTAKSIGSGGEMMLDYEDIFGTGANIIVSRTRPLGAGDYRLASFTIQVLPNNTLVPVDPDFDFETRLSPAGTGFTTTASESITVGGTEVVPEGTADQQSPNWMSFVIFGSGVIVGGFVVALVCYWRSHAKRKKIGDAV